MGRTKEEPIHVEETYRALLRGAVDIAGGQRAAAKLSDVDQTTVGRALRPSHRVTYTTLAKLSRALEGLPPPVVSIRDADHEEWCRLGSELAARKPATFGVLLDAVRQAIGDYPRPAPTPDAIEQLRKVVANPVPKHRARHRNGT